MNSRHQSYSTWRPSTGLPFTRPGPPASMGNPLQFQLDDDTGEPEGNDLTPLPDADGALIYRLPVDPRPSGAATRSRNLRGPDDIAANSGFKSPRGPSETHRNLHTLSSLVCRVIRHHLRSSLPIVGRCISDDSSSVILSLVVTSSAVVSWLVGLWLSFCRSSSCRWSLCRSSSFTSKSCRTS